MVVSGTRLSEQPIQRISGDWPLEHFSSRAELVDEVWEAQDLLLERAAWRGLSGRVVSGWVD